jgi:D-methionine transport system ATP-binding protein
MIILNNVSKTFSTSEGSLQAVSSLSLHVSPGDVFGIIGFSGAGKSTLLRMINLLEPPDEGGEVIVDGQILTALKRRELNLARHSIGMIFQHFNLLSNRTVYGNVSLPLEISGTPKGERHNRILECLEIVGLADKVNTYPAKLSGGQKQRVAIARALTTSPKVLLCDEPTSALDPQTTAIILGFLRDINQTFGTTIVMVTHEMHVVNAICNKVAVMENGRLIENFGLEDASYHPRSEIARLLLQARAITHLPEDLQQTAI